MMPALLGSVQACLGRVKASTRRDHFARRGSPRGNQFGKRIKIVLGLIARDAVLCDFGSGSLTLRLSSIVSDRVQICLGRSHRAFSGGHLCPRRHIVQRDEQFACGDRVAFPRIYGSYSGCDGTVKLIVLNGLHAAIGADRVHQHRVFHGRRAHRQALAQKVARREKDGNKDNSGADPERQTARLYSCLGHAMNQNQYIRLITMG